jgi:hypothetical protein
MGLPRYPPGEGPTDPSVPPLLVHPIENESTTVQKIYRILLDYKGVRRSDATTDLIKRAREIAEVVDTVKDRSRLHRLDHIVHYYDAYLDDHPDASTTDMLVDAEMNLGLPVMSMTGQIYEPAKSARNADMAFLRLSEREVAISDTLSGLWDMIPLNVKDNKTRKIPSALPDSLRDRIPDEFKDEDWATTLSAEEAEKVLEMAMPLLEKSYVKTQEDRNVILMQATVRYEAGFENLTYKRGDDMAGSDEHILEYIIKSGRSATVPYMPFEAQQELRVRARENTDVTLDETEWALPGSAGLTFGVWDFDTDDAANLDSILTRAGSEMGGLPPLTRMVLLLTRS